MNTATPKRCHDDSSSSPTEPVKRAKLEDESRCPQDSDNDIKTDNTLSGQDDSSKDKKVKRRKVVLLLIYSGWGYFGMQR